MFYLNNRISPPILANVNLLCLLWMSIKPQNNWDVTPIGITDWRNIKQPFGIKDVDRLRHIYCLGKSGSGKTTLLKSMASSDIRKGKGLCVIDPHGDLATSLIDFVPNERASELVYFDATNGEDIIAFNPLANVPREQQHLIASALVSTFKKIWFESWGPRLEYILHLSLLTLLQYPTATLLDIQPLLVSKSFRDSVLLYVDDLHIISFWREEFDKYPPSFRHEAISSILNKMGVFRTNLTLRNIVGQQKSSFSLPDVANEAKILLCNLAKGVIGEEASSLLGSMLLTSIQMVAMQRATIPESERRHFFVYVDEMHTFVTLSFVDMLSEARKFGISLFLTHQYMGQVHEKIRSAILGNVGTIICFAVGTEDAEILEKEFNPVFNAADLTTLPKFAIYLKLLIDGGTSKPFSANTTI